ncbi:hypothetical protein CG747_38445 [Streptomyces sp. CB02959]|nr:hypothetical protein CG747_38445 [Streptomyces sp. CB02959]
MAAVQRCPKAKSESLQFHFLAPLGRCGFRAGSPVAVAGSGDAESAAHELDAVCVLLLGVEPYLVDELVLAC